MIKGNGCSRAAFFNWAFFNWAAFINEGYQMRLFGGKLREHEGTHLIKKTHFPNKGPGSLKSSIKGSEGPCLYRIAIL